ncbi:unnamed protein product, partial [Dibothriocephalus latus]
EEENSKKESEKEANEEIEQVAYAEVDPLRSCSQEAHNGTKEECEHNPALEAETEQREKDTAVSVCQRARGVYVTPKTGLFPSAWPADCLPPGTEERFFVLGISIAKCL